MKSDAQARAPDTTAHFEKQVRADLRKRRWLRVHVTLIGIFTFLACWGISSALFHAGVQSLAMRHAGALMGAYGAYLLLLWMWSHYLLGKGDTWDLADGTSGINVGPSGGGRAASNSLRPGGGDFGGGGASAAWSEGAASSSTSMFSGVGDIASGAADALEVDEGAFIAIPLAIVIGIAALLATAMGFAVFGLFGIEVLLGVAVEIAFASAGGAIALKARRQGWMAHAIRRTAGPMAVVLVASVLASLAVANWMPDAKTLPDAIRLITQAFRS